MQKIHIQISDLTPAEIDQLGVIMFDAVRKGATEFYSSKQRKAWVPKIPSGASWAARLASQKTVVARKAERPIGFMTLDKNGYIEFAFVASEHQRQGIGGYLYTRIEALAHKSNLACLHSQASYLGRRLFEQQGWEVIHAQQIERDGTTLTNFLMEKHLNFDQGANSDKS